MFYRGAQVERVAGLSDANTVVSFAAYPAMYGDPPLVAVTPCSNAIEPINSDATALLVSRASWPSISKSVIFMSVVSNDMNLLYLLHHGHTRGRQVWYFLPRQAERLIAAAYCVLTLFVSAQDTLRPGSTWRQVRPPPAPAAPPSSKKALMEGQ